MPTATLMYHDVVAPGAPDESGFPGVAAGSYKLDRDGFGAHLDALRRAGMRSVTQDVNGDGGGVLLTFDDGGRSSLEVAQMLADRGWSGYFFTPTALIGEPGFAGADDLRAIHRLGHVVGSHSHTHPMRMSALDDAELEAEWARSAALLEAILGVPVESASVPGGYTSESVERAAAGAGFTTLFTSQPTVRTRDVDGCTVRGRYAIRRTTVPATAVSLATGQGTARGRHAATWAARGLPKRVLGDAYPRMRETLVQMRSSKWANLHGMLLVVQGGFLF
jgi:peptidoglycan/xylan/chitin deacetylase (PgdA/CDA1 family)